MEVENRFKAKIDEPNAYRAQDFNGFLHPKTPVITNRETDRIQFYQWGLIPFWAKNDDIKKFTLNAKIETLAQKPSFKNVVNNRCLVIADGFYEWQWLDPKGKHKQKYLITLPDNELFSFGGLWSQWTNKSTGEILNTYTLVTTEANELMAKIHNSKKRMPVILTRENEKEWLSEASMDMFKRQDINLIATKI